jgi:hypothetical protein
MLQGLLSGQFMSERPFAETRFGNCPNKSAVTSLNSK